MMKHKNISIVFISLLIIAILLMMSPRMLAYTIPAVENLKVEYTDGTANLSWSSVTNADGYEVFVNIPGYGYANIGSVSENKVSVIGISEDTSVLPGLSSHPKVSDRPADCDRTKIGILVDS